jgi:hypothetical protein
LLGVYRVVIKGWNSQNLLKVLAKIIIIQKFFLYLPQLSQALLAQSRLGQGARGKRTVG